MLLSIHELLEFLNKPSTLSCCRIVDAYQSIMLACFEVVFRVAVSRISINVIDF